MKVAPAVVVTRFAKLLAGDLCIVAQGALSYIAMRARDPAADGDPATLILGPAFPPGLRGITLQNPIDATVMSYGKGFALRLPATSQGWTEIQPPPEQPSILLAGEKAYFVANYAHGPGFFGYPCFIEMSTGVVQATMNRQYASPAGLSIYTTSWELVTMEEKPRTILRFAAEEQPDEWNQRGLSLNDDRTL